MSISILSSIINQTLTNCKSYHHQISPSPSLDMPFLSFDSSFFFIVYMFSLVICLIWPGGINLWSKFVQNVEPPSSIYLYCSLFCLLLFSHSHLHWKPTTNFEWLCNWNVCMPIFLWGSKILSEQCAKTFMLHNRHQPCLNVEVSWRTINILDCFLNHLKSYLFEG